MKRRPKYFMKMFALLSLAFSLILGIMIGAYYGARKNSLKNQSVLEHIAEFQNTGSEIDNVFNVVLTLGELILEYDSVKQYAMMNVDYYNLDFAKIMDIKNKISEHQTSFSNLNVNLALIKPSDDLVIMSSRTGSQDEFESEFGVTVDEMISLFSGEAETDYDYRILPREERSAEAKVVHRKIYDSGQPIYVLTTFLKSGFYIQHDAATGTYMLLSDNCSLENISNYREVLSRLDPGDIRKERLEDQKADLLFTKSKAANNMVYLSQYEDRSPVELYYVLVTTMILAVIVSIILAFFITMHMYRPIHRIVDLFQNGDEAADRDEIAFVTNRAVQIMELNNTLEKSLEEKNSELRDKFLFDLLNGFVWGWQLEEGLEKYGLAQLRCGGVCVLFEYENEVKKNAVYEVLEGEIQEKGGVGMQLGTDRYIFVLPRMEKIKGFLLELIELVRNQYGAAVTAALSENVTKAEDLKDAYLDLITVIEHKFVLGDREIITMKELEEVQSLDYYYPLETERQLIAYILSGKKENALLLLRGVFERNLFQVELSKRSLTEFQFAMTATIKRLLQKINKKEEEIFPNGEDIYQEFNRCESKEKLAKQIAKIIETIAQVASADFAAEEDEVCEKILQYIDDNLEKDLSMNDLSEQFELSVSNISKRLKDKYNIGFKSYLNEKRVEKAKKIMDENKKIKIKDLAPMVGFDNVASFIRVFKKQEGISPGQYLEQKDE